ncbi:hypothetical protein DesfrDRAFT_0294 [Solidesulfovibrio fructosivorans JJ]]|uniref:Uncharacterized protein n=1 Tax=Solidesulfovibrio fructosivorans JJ] TaxID=596151 RepID=E1JRP5_SOLFR|nr:hypothetical protein [Solidesulfovibrio fructosivorans]EFL53246.1 hypothetical protein DesfrDRAFT_0294 [Solidesulfovibrio fructosivorans JJ]]
MKKEEPDNPFPWLLERKPPPLPVHELESLNITYEVTKDKKTNRMVMIASRDERAWTFHNLEELVVFLAGVEFGKTL